MNKLMFLFLTQYRKNEYIIFNIKAHLINFDYWFPILFCLWISSAISNIIPTSQRACDTPARALPMQVRPLLEIQFERVINQLKDTFLLCVTKVSHLDDAGEGGAMGDKVYLL